MISPGKSRISGKKKKTRQQIRKSANANKRRPQISKQITPGDSALTDGVERRREAAGVEREGGEHREGKGEEEQEHRPPPRPHHLGVLVFFDVFCLRFRFPFLQTFLHGHV